MNSNQERLPVEHFVWFVAAVLSLATAFGAEIVVTNPGDQPIPGKTSLREAIAASAPNDVITFAVDQPIILTEGELVIDHDLELRGPAVGTPGHPSPRDTTGFRLFTINAGVVTFSHLTLRNGYVAAPVDTATSPATDAQGAAIFNKAMLHLTSCHLVNNNVNAGPGQDGAVGETGGNGEGGAIYNSGTLTVFACTFDGNTAAGGLGGNSSAGPGGAAGLSAGGAIFNTGTATVSNSTFSGNGAIGARGGNASTGEAGGKGGDTQGGAIHNAGTLGLFSSTFFHNSSNAGGAGFNDVAHDDNGGDAFGGAIFARADASTAMASNLVAGSYIRGGIAGNYEVFTYGMALGRDVFAAVTSLGFNLIGDASDNTGWVASDQLGTAEAPIDPMVQTFEHDNAGPTPTLSLKPGSPAIDQGNSFGLTSDQRGLARMYDDPAVPNAAGGDSSDVGAFELQPAPPATLQNVSTRARVGTGDEVLIGGVIVTGTEEKTIIFRALGQGNGSLDPLVDPVLELHDANGALIATNDNWFDTQAAEIELSDLAPLGPFDSAILLDLLPNQYTAIVHDKSGGSGTGLVEAYDIDPQTNSGMANISSRGKVGTGDDVMIGGFILGGGGGGLTTVVVRAIGPSLDFATTGLADPILELYDVDGALIGSNDNWKDTQEDEITAAGFAPADDQEAALIMDLPPGNYTAIVRGQANTTGIALVEVYRVE